MSSGNRKLHFGALYGSSRASPLPQRNGAERSVNPNSTSRASRSAEARLLRRRLVSRRTRFTSPAARALEWAVCPAMWRSGFAATQTQARGASSEHRGARNSKYRKKEPPIPDSVENVVAGTKFRSSTFLGRIGWASTSSESNDRHKDNFRSSIPTVWHKRR